MSSNIDVQFHEDGSCVTAYATNLLTGEQASGISCSGSNLAEKKANAARAAISKLPKPSVSTSSSYSNSSSQSTACSYEEDPDYIPVVTSNNFHFPKKIYTIGALGVMNLVEVDLNDGCPPFKLINAKYVSSKLNGFELNLSTLLNGSTFTEINFRGKLKNLANEKEVGDSNSTWNNKNYSILHRIEFLVNRLVDKMDVKPAPSKIPSVKSTTPAPDFSDWEYPEGGIKNVDVVPDFGAFVEDMMRRNSQPTPPQPQRKVIPNPVTPRRPTYQPQPTKQVPTKQVPAYENYAGVIKVVAFMLYGFGFVVSLASWSALLNFIFFGSIALGVALLIAESLPRE